MRRLRQCGEEAVLVECEDPLDALALWHGLGSTSLAGLEEAVPGATTVLVTGRIAPGELDRLLTLRSEPERVEQEQVVEIPVRYDGADLDGVARLLGLTPAEVVRRHQAGTYVGAFAGFSPGFVYLHGLDPALRVPRLETPRHRVPAGAVAIADVYAAVYPAPTPGGWRLLGTTDLELFDPARQPPALLRPGVAVRFTAVR